MSAGFDSLTDLKAYLLPSTLRGRDDWDTEIAILGKGVAAAFDRYCNRLFARRTGATMIVPADRWHVVVERYPIEQVTQVELKRDEETGWQAQEGAVEFVREDNGVVDFGSIMGRPNELLRLTYDGGYWWDESEDNSGSLPSGATALPEDLHLAWLQQVKDLWIRRDKLGQSFHREDQAPAAELLKGELLPMVKHTLSAYRRYMLT